jgi:hypothetical protein
MKRTIWVGLVAGLLLDALGWIGNQGVLRHLWKVAIAATVPLRHRTLGNEIISLVPDLLYGVALAWLVGALIGAGCSRAAATTRAAIFIWLVGPFVTYLGVWNTGFVPLSLASATTALALIVMWPAAWFVGRMLRVERTPATP